MRKISFLFVALLVFCFVQSLLAQADDDLAKYIRDHYDKREVMIPMRDGVRLFTSIYTPKRKSERYPILMNRTPYTVAPYGKDQYKTSLGPNKLFAHEGYIFVYQDVRGRYMSEGQFADVRPDVPNNTPQQTDESTDTYDTIDWLIINV